VNDVLDLHAVARSEFKLDPAPVAVASAALRTLEHCRRFVNSDVKLQFTLPPANAHVVVDFPRVAQFVKDAILYAFPPTFCGLFPLPWLLFTVFLAFMVV
jgi:hypothetical protein